MSISQREPTLSAFPVAKIVSLSPGAEPPAGRVVRRPPRAVIGYGVCGALVTTYARQPVRCDPRDGLEDLPDDPLAHPRHPEDRSGVPVDASVQESQRARAAIYASTLG